MWSTDVLFYVDVYIFNKQSIFSSQIRTPSFSINWPSLVSTARSPIILWRLWSHKPSHKHDSNKYQSKAFVICDPKSDETRSVTHENKAYLVWLMFRMLSNNHYPHHANQKLGSWANAVFQNRGVCGQAVSSFPSPSPVIHFFCSCLSFLDEPREETLATQATKKGESWRRETPDTDAFTGAFHPHTARFDTIQSKSLSVIGLSASRFKKLA